MGRARLNGQSGGASTITFSNYKGTKLPQSKRKIAPTLSQGRRYGVGGSLNSYALFTGGMDYNGQPLYTVEAYNKSLVKSSPSNIGPHAYAASCSNGINVLFAGGRNAANNSIVSSIDAFNDSLVKFSVTALTIARESLAGARTTNHMLFGGGRDSGMNVSNVVDVYDSSLTRLSPKNLSNARYGLAAGRAGNYALFAGGNGGGGGISYVECISDSLVLSSASNLSYPRETLAVAELNNSVIFAGGYYNGDSRRNMDKYDSSLTRSTLTSLTFERQDHAGASNGNVLFGGGTEYKTSYVQGYPEILEEYDSTFTKINYAEGLTTDRKQLIAVSVGDFALFGGGSRYGSSGSEEYPTVVEAFSLFSDSVQLPVTKGSKYNFSGSEITAENNIDLNLNTPVNGYIKYKKGEIS